MAGASPLIPDYELLRPVGRGAYGEVWLARSVTGIYRAAKIVYRASFEEARPFEREFAGMQSIEPLSRAQENQITILHVGRNEAAGYFYYVMELADDAKTGEEIVPDNYVPNTLKEMRARRRRLPAGECLAIGIALTRALAHLHRNGLVHRDIKPSNVVFVHGVPKLADIGLVSKIDDSRSFVGTEGFVPPEGPGNIQADLFSLGKVLYEISTGRDRKEFPKLPDDLDELSDERALLELNEVMLKACDPDLSRRYSSAEAMHDDLLLLQAGKSVKRLHLIERRFQLVAKYGIAATALTLAAAAAFFWASFQARKARENFALSERHRVAAEQALRDSELNQARARRMTGLAGQRFETLALFGRLAAESNRLELRNEAIASLVLPDLRPWKQWSKNLHQGMWQFDSELQRYATNDALGNITVRDAATDRELALLPGQGAVLTAIMFSPDRNRDFLAAADRAGRAVLWDLSTRKSLPLDFSQGSRLIGFAPESRAIIVKDAGMALHFLNTITGEEEQILRGPFRTDIFSFSPNGEWLCRLRSNLSEVMVHRAADMSSNSTLLHPQRVMATAWHPDSRHLVTSSGNTIYFWDALAGRELAIAEGHESQVVGLAFDSTGELLVSASWDGTTRLWRFDRRRELVRTGPSGNGLRISPDGRRVTFNPWNHQSVQLWHVAPGREVRRFELPHDVQRVYRTAYNGGFSPDGAVLHIDSIDGIFIFDAQTLRPLSNLPSTRSARAAFHPSGEYFITSGAEGLRRWPLRPNSMEGGYNFGPPQAISSIRVNGSESFSMTLDGVRLASRDSVGIRVLDLRQPDSSRYLPLLETDGTPAISANGRWLTVRGKNKRPLVWDTHRDTLATNLNMEMRGGANFSPDNRWLVAGGGGQYHFWETDSWRAGVRIKGREASALPVAAAFTRDAKVVALATENDSIRLYFAGTDQQLAELPGGRLLTHLSFSSDSTKLLAVYEAGTAELWDLRLLRDGLSEMNLAWEDFFPPARSLTTSINKHSGDSPAQHALAPKLPLTVTTNGVAKPSD
jgi:WD40 repeat protein